MLRLVSLVPQLAANRWVIVCPVAVGGNVGLDDVGVRFDLGVEVVDVMQRHRFQSDGQFRAAEFNLPMMADHEMLEL